MGSTEGITLFYTSISIRNLATTSTTWLCALFDSDFNLISMFQYLFPHFHTYSALQPCSCESSSIGKAEQISRVCQRVEEGRDLPQIVSATKDKVGFGVQGRAHLPQATVTAGTFQAVFMPIFVQGLQKISVFNLTVAASTTFRLGVWLD